MAEISTDVLFSCNDENRRGGIKRIFVANRDDITSLPESKKKQNNGSTNKYFNERLFRNNRLL